MHQKSLTPKAFDLVNHEKMFRILVKRNVHLVFLRLLIAIYINQKCYVKWNCTRSYSFNVTNGTRQGAVFSPRGGFNTYLHELQHELRKSGHGLQLGTKWYGALFWADDGILLSTSVQGLQNLVDICQSHAAETDLIFSTDVDITKSKTFCIAFNCQNSENLSPVILNGNPLPWKKTVKHVGVTLNSNGTMESEIKDKRARFIQRSMEINEEFECLTPECKQKLHRLYNNHWSGSCCWNFDDKLFQQLVNSYNVNMRIVYSLPCDCHCWIVEGISGGNHAKKQIYSRYVKFVNTLANTSRDCVRFLFKYVSDDVRSQVAGNIRKIFLDSSVLIVPGQTRPSDFSDYTVYPVPEGEEHRIPLIQSLREILSDNWTIIFNEEEEDEDNFETNDIQIMINDLCSN